MTLFHRTEDIYIYSEDQKDQMMERLERSGVSYQIFQRRQQLFTDQTSYIIRIDADDMKKVA